MDVGCPAGAAGFALPPQVPDLERSRCAACVPAGGRRSTAAATACIAAVSVFLTHPVAVLPHSDSVTVLLVTGPKEDCCIGAAVADMA